MTLREQIVLDAPRYLAWGGAAIGVVFGMLVERTRFCAMGALSDAVAFDDRRRLRSWLLASAVAIIGAQSLQTAGVVDLGLSMYLSPSLNWLGNILGGLMFGVGMVFAGGCASRNLVRLGGGDLRAAVVLVVMGVFAYMTLGGLLGPLRAALESATAVTMPGDMSQSLASLPRFAGGVSSESARGLVSVALAGALLIYCLRDAAFRASPVLIAGGIGVGLCVVAAWALSGLAYDEFADLPQAPQSLSFVRPAGDTLEYLHRGTATLVGGLWVATGPGRLFLCGVWGRPASVSWTSKYLTTVS